MQKKLYAFLAAFLLLLPFALNSGAAHAQSQSTVSVGGEASFYVTPDEAVIEVGVQTSGRRAQDVSLQNAAAMSNVKNALLSLGVSPENVETGSYQFYPIYDNNNQSIKGYQAENTLRIKTENLAKIGEIIDTAIKNGATEVTSVNFRVKDVKKAEHKALQLAVANAKENAQVIAGSLGRHIVNVVSVNAGNAYVENYQAPDAVSFRSVKDAAGTTPVTARKLKVRASVEAKFAID